MSTNSQSHAPHPSVFAKVLLRVDSLVMLFDSFSFLTSSSAFSICWTSSFSGSCGEEILRSPSHPSDAPLSSHLGLSVYSNLPTSLLLAVRRSWAPMFSLPLLLPGWSRISHLLSASGTMTLLFVDLAPLHVLLTSILSSRSLVIFRSRRPCRSLPSDPLLRVEPITKLAKEVPQPQGSHQNESLSGGVLLDQPEQSVQRRAQTTGTPSPHARLSRSCEQKLVSRFFVFSYEAVSTYTCIVCKMHKSNNMYHMCSTINACSAVFGTERARLRCTCCWTLPETLSQ